MANVMAMLQLLGAGSVGGLVSQYVTAAPERRQTRTRAREAMVALEEARWSRGQEDEWQQLRERVHAFESIAIVAGVPRPAAQWYVRTTVALHLESRRELSEHGNPDLAGIPLRYLDAFASATDLIYWILWHPQLARLTWRRRLKRSKAEVTAATADSATIRDALTRRTAI